MMTHSRRPTILLLIQLFVGITALVCGLGLMVNGLGIPREQLQGTPFDSFVIPGLILAIVVGGSLIAAAWMTWRRSSLASRASLIAGCILLGWIMVEATMIDDGRVLQVIVCVLALLVIWLAWISKRPAANRLRKRR